MALPTSPPFDLYAIGPGASMGAIFGNSEVDAQGNVAMFNIASNLLTISSGGSFPEEDARLVVDVTVPASFSLEAVFRATSLPLNFSDIRFRHLFFSSMDAAGNSVGLFMSKIGLMYAGSVRHIAGDLVIDSPTQLLPNSSLLIEEDVSYTVRLVTSYETETTYIYWTRTEDVVSIGHQLRFVVPAIKSSTAVVTPPDQSLFSLRGTVAEATEAVFTSLKLGSGLLIPNIAPVANAGVDQAVKTCAIVQFDGSASFDPEGASVLYKWRLIDTPLGSEYIFDGGDAITYPLGTPTGFTTKVHSVELNALEAIDAIEVGCVVVIAGLPYEVVSKGIDGNGFYVQTSTDVPDSYTNVTFKLVRQRGISGPTDQKPTFLPDKPGLYKLDLVVYDGDLYSQPAVTIVNVTESPIPRGLIPDLRFLWGYLSDFWTLIEEKERIEVFWSGMAQVAAAELLNLWQLDYSKSLRDVQRTFQRRWLRYDLAMYEDPIQVERTSARAVFGGLLSSTILAGGIAPAVLEIVVGGTVYPINIGVAAGATPGDVVDAFIALLQPQLDIIDPRLVVSAVKAQSGATAKVRLNAPFLFSVKDTSTTSLFPFETNTYPQGSGTAIGERTYRVDRGLNGVDVQENDFLVLDSGAYRIARVSTDATDTYGAQRITTIDPLPTNAPLTWAIGGTATAQTLDFWYGTVVHGDIVFIDVVSLSDGSILSLEALALGANPFTRNKLAFDGSSVGSYLLDPTAYSVYIRGVLRRNYIPVDRLVQDVPYLQEKIKSTDDEQVLRRNVDYFLEAFRGVKVLRFIVGTPDVWQGENPPLRLWAENTYLDNRPMIESNFGIPAAFTLDDLAQLPTNLDYLSAVRGLWYSYFNGPTLFNLRAGVQILLGLPFAEEAGTIEEIRDDFSSTTGRILVRDSLNTEIVRSYTYPTTLDLETNAATGEQYKVGDVVSQFAPLVLGAEVIDWVKDPKWIEGYINQGSRFEVEKFFNFVVRVNADAFNLSALLFAQSFVKRIKPTYTHPIFIVQRSVAESEVSVSDDIKYRAVLDMHVGPHFGPTGQAQMWDQARPGGGGYWNQFDTSDPNAPQTTPPGTAPTAWINDQYDLAPEEAILATLKQIWAGGIPKADGIFYADMPVFTTVAATFVSGSILRIPVSPGIAIGTPFTSIVTTSMTKAVVMFRGVGDGATLTLKLFKNAALVGTFTFVIPVEAGNPDANLWKFQFNLSINVVPGDILTTKLYHPTGFNTFVEAVGVCVGAGVNWFADTVLPANTYRFCLPI